MGYSLVAPQRLKEKFIPKKKNEKSNETKTTTIIYSNRIDSETVRIVFRYLQLFDSIGFVV